MPAGCELEARVEHCGRFGGVSGLWQMANGDKVARRLRPAIPTRMGDQDVTQAAMGQDWPPARVGRGPPRLVVVPYGDPVRRRPPLRSPGTDPGPRVLEGGAAQGRRSSGLSA